MKTPRRRTVWLVAGAAIAAAGCGGERSREAALDPVARVGDRAVSEEEFERFLMRHGGLAPEEIDPTVRASLYENFLAELLFARAAGRRGLEPDAEAVAKESSALAALDAGLTEAQRREEAERTVLARAYVERVIAPEVSISEEDIDAKLPPLAKGSVQYVVIRHIFVESAEIADEAYRRIKGGEAFEAVARGLSEAPGTGQPLQRRLDELPEEAARILQGLPEGAVSRPVAIGDGHHLFQLDARTSDPDPGRARERAEVRRRLFRERLDRLSAQELQQLAAEEKVRVPRLTADSAEEDPR